jgi:D-glycero-alpha-D-manno-heptose-7-phosphate kinase
MIIARAPFRVSFFGGGTDYPDFFLDHGGAVLLTTIDHYCYLSIHRISQFFQYRLRASYAQTEMVQHASEFRHPLIRESLLLLGVDENLEITHVSDLPGRTGLGTSSTFTVALLHALHALRGDRVTEEDLAREAICVERERVGDAGGYQDQYAAAYGGLLRLDFGRDRRVAVRRLTVSAARIRELEKRLVLFYMGREQSADDIVREQNRRTSQNTEALREMLGMVTEGERILCGDGDLDGFGLLLHEAWMRKKGLAQGISNNEIDQAYAAARSAGALGGKLLGGGGRGFLLVYVPPERRAAVCGVMNGLRQVTFSFSSHGSGIIFGARQDQPGGTGAL